MNLRDESDPFWRKIYLVAHDGRVEAEVEDNVHHFAVTVFHDGTRVTQVTGQAIRVPWVTCPGAISRLGDLVGATIADAGRASLDQTQHCTHMLDLARMAIAQAGRGGSRRYACHVHYDPDRGVIVAALQRDGASFAEWAIADGRVISPGPYFGHAIDGRSQWSDAVRADPDLLEAGLAMRRVVFVFRRRQDTRPRYSADETEGMTGVCYSFQPERAALAVRPANFTELP